MIKAIGGKINISEDLGNSITIRTISDILNGKQGVVVSEEYRNKELCLKSLGVSDSNIIYIDGSNGRKIAIDNSINLAKILLKELKNFNTSLCSEVSKSKCSTMSFDMAAYSFMLYSNAKMFADAGLFAESAELMKNTEDILDRCNSLKSSGNDCGCNG